MRALLFPLTFTTDVPSAVRQRACFKSGRLVASWRLCCLKSSSDPKEKVETISAPAAHPVSANRTKDSFTSPKNRRHFPFQSAASARERNSHLLQGRPRQKLSHSFLNGLTDHDLLAPRPSRDQQHAGRCSGYTILDCCTSSYGHVPAAFLVI